MDNSNKIKRLQDKTPSLGLHDLTPAEHKHTQRQFQVMPFILGLMNHRYLKPSIYIVLSAFLFFFLAMIFYTSVLRLKIEMAVVNTPIETIVAPVSGYITDVYVTAGEIVKKGVPLVKIENINLERDLGLAKIKAKESSLNVEYYKNLLANEQQKLKIYQHIGSNRLISANTLVNSSQQDMLAAKNHLQRLSILYKKQYVSKSNWENGVAKYVRVKEKLRYAKAQQNLENHSLNAVNKGLYFTGNKLEGIVQDLSAELEAAKKKEILSRERVNLYTKLSNKLVLTAPFDGKINQIIKSAGNTTDNAKPILLIEQTRAHKNIIAYLTQNEIAHIGDANKVKIYLPSTGKMYRGKITEINRTDGFIDVVKAQFTWRDLQMDRSGMVSIDIQQNDQFSFNNEAYAGMPVVIYFSRRFLL